MSFFQSLRLSNLWNFDSFWFLFLYFSFVFCVLVFIMFYTVKGWPPDCPIQTHCWSCEAWATFYLHDKIICCFLTCLSGHYAVYCVASDAVFFWVCKTICFFFITFMSANHRSKLPFRCSNRGDLQKKYKSARLYWTLVIPLPHSIFCQITSISINWYHRNLKHFLDHISLAVLSWIIYRHIVMSVIVDVVYHTDVPNPNLWIIYKNFTYETSIFFLTNLTALSLIIPFTVSEAISINRYRTQAYIWYLGIFWSVIL